MPLDMSDFPELHIQISQLPAIKDWKVGAKYKILLEVEQLEISKSSGGFKILSVTDASDKPIEEQSKAQFKKTTEKALGSGYNG